MKNTNEFLDYIGLQHYDQKVKHRIKTYLDEKLNTSGGTVTGDLTVEGNFRVEGNAVETHLENVKIPQNSLTLREGATESLLDNQYTGIIAEKYDGANNGMLVFDKGGTAYVGDEGDLQPLATRSFSDTDDGAIVAWNASAKTLTKAPVEVEDIVTKDNVDSVNKVLSTATKDNSVAYQKDVIVEKVSYAAVQKIGGMTRKCSNLLPLKDYSRTVVGVSISIKDGVVTAKGTATTSGGRTNALSDTFILQAGTYDFSYIGDVDGAFPYLNKQAGGTVIAASGAGSIFTLTESTAVFFGINFTQDVTYDISFKLMLNEGTTALPYEPYYEGLRDAKVTAVKSVGANVANISLRYGLWVFNENRISSSENYVCTASKIAVKPNTTYSLSGNAISVLSGNLGFFGADGAYLGSQVYVFDTFTTPENAHYFTFHIGKDYVNDISGTIMLNKGSTALPYTPYVEHTMPIPEVVQALDGYGWGVNESVYNYIDYEKKQFIKRVGKVDLGTLNWTYINAYGTGVMCFRALCDNIKPVSTTTISNVLCSLFNAITADAMSRGKEGVTSYGPTPSITIFTSQYADATLFKSAMSGVMLYYELAELIVTDISDLITADNMLGVEGGGTLTFENEYSYDVPSEVVFYNEKAEIIASDKIVGNLIGTSARAISDEDGNSITGTYMKKSSAFEVIFDASGASIKVGNTVVSEAQFQKLIAFIDSVELS